LISLNTRSGGGIDGDDDDDDNDDEIGDEDHLLYYSCGY